ncbi:MAG: aminotransferase class V-fold PLP-dependent enzyme [Gammaproteobacteria bacterium]|nr:aminotransferase class V-fold PLP-dependent enzyme [Gammaproteobacteria bacterium]
MTSADFPASLLDTVTAAMPNTATAAATVAVQRPAPIDRQQMLDKLRASTTGLEVQYQLATGETTRRIYLDSTASTLQLGVVADVLRDYLPHYANTHSDAHFNAKLSTREFAWAHDMTLDFVGASPDTHGCFFVGSGATGGINRVARTLARKWPERDVVVTTVMEHHSNDLPHRKNFARVVHAPVTVTDSGFGCADVARIAQALEQHAGRVNYVAVTGVSNVTGIVNPIHDIAELAHKHGAILVVDAAQMAAHVPIRMSGNDNPARDLDIVCLSGHKIYAPSSPGAVVTRRDLFAGVEPDEVGGGMVDDVYLDRYLSTDKFPDREEAGTPNIIGGIALATSLAALQKIGMDFIAAEETALINRAVAELSAIDDVVVYGETDTAKCKRAGAISINIRGMHHALTAAILNDYFNIAVRNACFCAHPYVREMIADDLGEQMDGLTNEELEALAEMHRGMVRASFGIYNTARDVDALSAALQKICADKEFYQAQYHATDCGDAYIHNTFAFDSRTVFSAKDAVEDWFAA